jgi:hypothetical protein
MQIKYSYLEMSKEQDQQNGDKTRNNTFEDKDEMGRERKK